VRERYNALRRTHNGGFTLIELLIAIVILGVLSGVVVFAVSGITDRGDKAACKADRSTIQVAVEAHHAKIGSYPAAGAAGYTALKTGGFIKDAPSSDKYTITLEAGGVVNGDLTGGAATTDCSA
jgi:general secretion pathway protein G